MIPIGARSILDARMAGSKPAEGVVVSFVGSTDMDGPHVHPRSGEVYDWRFLGGLQVTVVVKRGVDASEAMRAIFAETIKTTGYPWIVDLEREEVGALIEVKPLRIRPVRRGCSVWKGFFA